MKIAIVGAEEKAWTDDQKQTVKDIITKFLRRYSDNPVLISGGCPKGGVDIWAEECADRAPTIPKQIFKPEVEQWEDDAKLIHPIGNQRLIKKGYKSRNIEIAEACDILYCFTSNGKHNGGVWTAKYAKSLGKKVVMIDIS